MSKTDCLKTLHLIKGTTLDLVVHKQDAEKKYGAVLHYDGEKGSEPFFVAPHWHKYHDEYITVLEGRMMVTIESKITVLSAGDPTAFIPRLHIHSFEGFKGIPTAFEETNEPPGIYKALFFNDAFHENRFPGFWRGVRSGFDGDTYGHLSVINSKFVDQLFVLIFGAIAKLFVSPKPETID